MKTPLLFGFLLLLSIAGFAQKEKELKKVLELQITDEGGANGAAVAWHPVQKKYYAAMAGNMDYPFQVFDATGKVVSTPGLKTMADLRGLWYNPKVQKIQANTYADNGLVQYKLDTKGMPLSVDILDVPVEKPDEQSVAAFNPIHQRFYFFNEGKIDSYNLADGTVDTSVELHLSYATKEDADNGTWDNEDLLESYNIFSIVYTGIAGSEIGLLQTEDQNVELYSKKTGYMTQRLYLPNDAPKIVALNFSYSNGIYWLFDKDNRKWIGYK